MENPYFTLLSLIWPIVLGILLLIYIFFIYKEKRDKDKPKSSEPVYINIPLWLVSFRIPVRRLFVIRLIIILIAFSLFAIPAFRDYSIYFPTYYFMDVYFDDDGIIQALNDFNKKEIESMNISKDWRNKKKQYYNKINKYLFKTINISNFFESTGRYIHSTGESTLISEKVKGWQQYHIVRSYGSLENCVELPNESSKIIKSEFSLADTKDNYISLSLYDIYIKHTKIIKPQYKQMLSTIIGGQRQTYNNIVINMTKLTFFPIIKISKTIYFIRDNDGIHLVPIAYAIYRPK